MITEMNREIDKTSIELTDSDRQVSVAGHKIRQV